MIPVYEPVDLWLACILTGGSVAMLYSLATMWRLEKHRRSSREPFVGVDMEALSEPARQLVLDALAFRASKPTPLWPPMVGMVLPFALACRFYQVAFGLGHHAALPATLMGWPSLLLTMGIGFCLIPVVSVGSVNRVCWKIAKAVRKSRKALTG